MENHPELEQHIPRLPKITLRILRLSPHVVPCGFQTSMQHSCCTLVGWWPQSSCHMDLHLWSHPPEWPPSCMQHVDQFFEGPAPWEQCCQCWSFWKWCGSCPTHHHSIFDPSSLLHPSSSGACCCPTCSSCSCTRARHISTRFAGLGRCQCSL